MRVKIKDDPRGWIEADEVGIAVELNAQDKADIGSFTPGQAVLYRGPDFEGIGKWIAEENVVEEVKEEPKEVKSKTSKKK